jgi:uncharacterized protein (DUF433 family)
MSATEYPLPTPIITVSSDWLGGEPCFTGRRVPVKALFDYLKSAHTLEEFLADYPSVSRAHVVAVIDLATRSLTVSYQLPPNKSGLLTWERLEYA